MYNYNCNKPCRLCDRSIISQSVTVITVNGTDTLVIDLPSGTYMNKTPYCITIAQPIPTTATIAMPVAISIGGVTTTVYPLTTCNCLQVTACQIATHTRYKTCVSTNGVSGSFRVLNTLPCSRIEPLPSLPVAAAAAASATVSASVATPTVKTTVAKTSATTTAKPKTAESVTISAQNVTVNKEDK